MKTSRLWTRNYICLLSSNIFTCFSYIAISTIITLYIRDIGGNNRIAGIITGGMTFFMMFTRPFAGRLLDRLGRKPVLIAGAGLFALNTIAYCFASSIAVLTVVRLIYGTTMVLYTTSTITMLSDIIPPERTVEGMAFYNISGGIACALGPTIGQLLYDGFGAHVFFAVMAACATLGGAVVLLVRMPAAERLRASKDSAPRAGGLRGILEGSALWPGLIWCFVTLGYGAAQNFLLACGAERGVANASIFFTVSNIVMILANLAGSKLTGRFGYRVVIGVSVGVLALGVSAIAFAYSLPAFLICGLLFGMGYGTVQPLLYALVFRFSPPERRGAAIATYGLLSDCGSCLSSLFCGEISTVAGYTATYLFSGAFVGVGLLLHLFGLCRKLKRETEA